MPCDTPITLRSDALCARILPRGATLADLRFRGTDQSLVLGFDDPANHQNIPVYAGAIVGPVANRISGGEITIDGITHHMPLNEHNRTCLHSGPDGLHALDWRLVDQSDEAVTLGIGLADGAQGLPGNRDITVTYHLAGTTLILTITARTDQTTPINIAAHPYWNLDGTSDLSGHELQINASEYTAVNDHNLPTGQIVSVANSGFDFRQPRAVPLIPALDVNYCLHRSARQYPLPCATLTGAHGITLCIATTAPGLQVYNGAFLPEYPGVLHALGHLRPYGGLALEPQFWPDAPHHSHFPQINLAPGQLWQQVTTYWLSPPA